MTSALGTFLDATTLRFERRLPGPIDRVWAYLTTPACVAEWFAEATIEPWPGGAVEWRIIVEQLPEKRLSGHVAHGVITAWEPNRTFAYTWNDVNGTDVQIRYDLAPSGDDVRLTLTQSNLVPAYVVPAASGWHAFLDVLASRLREEPPESFVAATQALFPLYEVLAAKL